MAHKAMKKQWAKTEESDSGTSLLVPLYLDFHEEAVIFIPGGWGGNAEVLLFASLGRKMAGKKDLFALLSGAELMHDIETSRSALLPLKEHAEIVFHEIQTCLGEYHRLTLVGECLASSLTMELATLLERSAFELNPLILLDPWTPSPPLLRILKSPKKTGVELPRSIQSYYDRVKTWKLPSIKTPIHLLLTRDSEQVGHKLRYWKRLTHDKFQHHALSGDHDSYIRQDATETATVIESILRSSDCRSGSS
jgi:surfactin synthase thioesterase subunit